VAIPSLLRATRPSVIEIAPGTLMPNRITYPAVSHKIAIY